MIKIPNDHVALSINSLVLCTPKEAEDVPQMYQKGHLLLDSEYDNNDQAHMQ